MEADDAVIFCLRFVLNEVPRGNLTGWLTKDEKASDLKLCGDVCVCVCFQTHTLGLCLDQNLFVHLSVSLVCPKAADELPNF